MLDWNTLNIMIEYRFIYIVPQLPPQPSAALSSQTEPACSCSPSPSSRTLVCSHTALC